MEIISQPGYNDRIGFGTRFGALIIDFILICGITFIIGMMGLTSGGLLGAVAGAGDTESAMSGSFIGGIMGFFTGLILATFFYSLLEAFTGLTVGKMLLGIRVKNENGTEGNTSLYLKRWAIKNSSTLLDVVAWLTGSSFISTIGSLCSIAIFIGCFFVLGEKKQALHDILAKTAVFKK